MIVSGPSGVGKGSVLKELENLEGVAISISATTRKRRNQEKDGIDYFFISREEFEEHIKKDDMVEYNEYCGNLYGTIKSKLEDLLSNNDLVILEIDVNGSALVLEKFDCVRVFLMPPSFEELKRRLENRGTEEKNSIERRLKEAFVEVKKGYSYDYLVVNDDIKKAADDIMSIARAEFLNIKRKQFVMKDFLKNSYFVG